ncbi:MAG: sigma-54 dependent transcriptional regulator [Proteobacteria bacterium]|nr:sigma-54 dependent transcriptional regulator [Pseudomonadota bacterium]
MSRYSIFLIDDEESIRKGIGVSLKKEYEIETFADAESALQKFTKKIPDLILLDIGLPGMNGIEALKEIKKIDPRIIVIMITGFEEIDTVISSMKAGAYDYIVKPVRLKVLKHCLNKALETIRLQKEVRELQEKAVSENMPCIIGESNVIQHIIQFIRKAASSPDTPILITGESGTGKDLIAKAIHYQSPNFAGPYVTLNCAAIPNELIESELFGYEKGAFSGAQPSGKKGLLEEADGGTLFLDEIGDLSLNAQAKLLRWLEDGTYYRVGGTAEWRSTVRVVSATNKNIEQLIEERRFRLDLYYRIGVISIEIPSLNDRNEDVIPIAEYYLNEFSKKLNKSFAGFTPETEIFLKNHHWNGNIRELKNMIERGAIIGSGDFLAPEDLGFSGAPLQDSKSSGNIELSNEFPGLPPGGINLEKLERHLILEALKQAEGNDTKAAKLLGLNYYAFRYRRKKADQADES